MNLSIIKKPFFAVIAALLLVAGTSAFKPALVPNYGQDASGNWHNLSGLTKVAPNVIPAAGEYRCIESTRLCTAEFDYPEPSQNANDYIESGEQGTAQFGQ